MLENGMIRSLYIGKTLKNIIEEKNITISDIAKRIGSSQPTLSNSLKGKGGSDDYFVKVGKSLGLSNDDLKEIFKNADKEEYKYKYGEDITDPNLLEDIDFDVALKREYGKELNQTTIDKIKEFIEFVKNK